MGIKHPNIYATRWTKPKCEALNMDKSTAIILGMDCNLETIDAFKMNLIGEDIS